MRDIRFAFLAVAFTAATLASSPAFALSAQSGMPREPQTAAGQCAKANMGVHIPYRGWRARDRLGFRTCMWPFWTAAFHH